MTEAKGAPLLERTTTRRGFLKSGRDTAVGLGLAAIVGVTLESGLSNAPGDAPYKLTRNFWERLQTGTLFESSTAMSKEFENKYGVQILSPTEEENGFSLGEYGELVQWDAPRIDAVSDVLNKLPDSFYRPHEVNGERKPLGIALVQLSPDANKLKARNT